MREDIHLVKEDCLRTQVKTVENELATVKAEVCKIQSDITSIKDILGNLCVHIEAMKSVLIPTPVIGTGSVPDVELDVVDEELSVDIKSNPGSNGKQMQSLDCCGLSSLNTTEVSFKPHPSSKTYNKTLTSRLASCSVAPRHDARGKWSEQIADSELFELTQRTKDNPEVRDRIDEEEMLCRDDEEESQRSPSQSVISGVLKHRRHHVPDTVDKSSMLWPVVSDTEIKDTHSGKGKTTYFPPEHLVEAVQA